MNNPILLQKQLRENNSDLVDYCNELKKWGKEIKEKEQSFKKDSKDLNSAEVAKKKVEVKKVKKSVKSKNVPEVKSKVPKSAEYWDKLQVDTTSEEDDSDLTDEFDDDIIELANEEKEKGNNCVKKGDFSAAIVHYTEAISHHKYDPVYYANRALCYNKLKDYRNAEADCTTALQLDNDYVKALHRRGVARESLGQLNEAKEDLQRVLILDPNNKESRNLLDKINKKIQPEETYQKPVSKFTLSRNKATPKAGPSSAPSSKPEIAVKQHVVERKKPVEILEKKTELLDLKKVAEKRSFEVSWPAGDDVEIVESVFKPPKERSKGRLKRLTVFAGEAGLNAKKTVGAEPSKQVTVDEKKAAVDKVGVVRTDNTVREKNVVVDSGRSFEESILRKNGNFAEWKPEIPEDLQIAKSSIQFYGVWKGLSVAERKSYLALINPLEFKNIFKDNLENKVFSEIIRCLDSEDSSFECLYGLTKVNRFTTMVMFANKEDTIRLRNLWREMEKSQKYSKDELEFVFKEKYKVKI